MNTEDVTEAAKALHEKWRQALVAYRADPDSPLDLYAAEDAAHETLVEFVEQNDLNYSKWDPR